MFGDVFKTAYDVSISFAYDFRPSREVHKTLAFTAFLKTIASLWGSGQSESVAGLTSFMLSLRPSSTLESCYKTVRATHTYF